MTTIARYIGTNGDILIPVTSTSGNTSNLLSLTGAYYLAQAISAEPGSPIGLLLALTYPGPPTPIVSGNPMGLLLTLTYPS